MTKTYRIDTSGASACTGFAESRLNRLRCDGNGPVLGNDKLHGIARSTKPDHPGLIRFDRTELF